MEQKRLFIAIGISFLIFFAWSKFFAPPMTPPPEQAAQEESQSITDDQTEAKVMEPTAASTESVPEPVAPLPVRPARPARTITVDTPLFTMTLSEEGGAVVGMVLKKFRETMDEDSARKELIHAGSGGSSVVLDLTGTAAPGLEKALFDLQEEKDRVKVEKDAAEVRFVYQAPSGMTVERSYKFSPDSYLVDVSVTLTNGSGQTYQGGLALGLRNNSDEYAGRISFEGPSGYIDGDLVQVKIKDIEDSEPRSGNIKWISLVGRYFMSSIIPDGEFSGRMVLAQNDKVVKNQLAYKIEELLPQKSKTIKTQLFMGPKSYSLLKSFNNGLDKAIDFGWFDFLAKPCLIFMNFIYRYIPNYGIAIIILTIITRGIFWPLARKSYKSMGEMRKIQPLMKEIREKYKDDKPRMNQEMMTLYRTYKINPLGGCLPMLIQLPVFLALYKMLYSAIELRHAPFFGWITDLSAPDRLFNFAVKIPLMDQPTGIPVLTLIMGASMILQQKMTPTPGDPAQAKMMMLMPVVFTFIFINFPSGLVLYWLVSNLFSMAQQYYTQKAIA